jgi:ppGpp synthetase/RelA/SpoT-type nucleotidyltranferase
MEDALAPNEPAGFSEDIESLTMETLSKARIDRLGERLRGQAFGEAELRLLDEYRRTFGLAYDRVVANIQRIIGVPVSGRPAKSTSSIIEKLNRESIRLSQMQDIAGCRAIVADLAQQDRVVNAIVGEFENVAIQDRREKPSHGYRAVHLIVRVDGKPIEVQVRTSLQHVWAEMSEKFADIIDPSIKYGGGPTVLREALDNAATQSRLIEELEAKLAGIGAVGGEIAQQLSEARDKYVNNLHSVIRKLNETGLEAFS